MEGVLLLLISWPVVSNLRALLMLRLSFVTPAPSYDIQAIHHILSVENHLYKSVFLQKPLSLFHLRDKEIATFSRIRFSMACFRQSQQMQFQGEQ